MSLRTFNAFAPPPAFAAADTYGRAAARAKRALVVIVLGPLFLAFKTPRSKALVIIPVWVGLEVR